MQQAAASGRYRLLGLIKMGPDIYPAILAVIYFRFLDHSQHNGLFHTALQSRFDAKK